MGTPVGLLGLGSCLRGGIDHRVDDTLLKGHGGATSEAGCDKNGNDRPHDVSFDGAVVEPNYIIQYKLCIDNIFIALYSVFF